MKTPTPHIKSKSRFRSLASFVCSGLLTCIASHAAMVTTSTTTLSPTEGVILDITGALGNAATRWTGNALDEHRYIGQTFTWTGSEGNNLTEAIFQIASVGSAATSQAFTLSIYTFTDINSVEPTGLVYTGSGTLPSTMSTNDYLHFTFDNPIVLEAGKQYGVLIGFSSGPTANQTLNFYTNVSYANGLAIYYSNSPNPGVMSYRALGTGPSTGADFRMMLVVPEPGTSLLLGLACVSLLFMKYLRRAKLSPDAPVSRLRVQIGNRAKFLLPLFGGLLIFTSNIFAEVETTASAEYEPNGPAIGVFSQRGGDIRWFHINNSATGRRDVGQIFVAPEDLNLNRLVLRVAFPSDQGETVGADAYSSEFTIRFYQINEISELAQSAPISAQSGRLPESFQGGDYLSLNLKNIPLKQNRTYAFVLTFDSPSPNRGVNFMTDHLDAYPEGKAFVFMTESETSDPEPKYSELHGNLQFNLLSNR